MRTIHTLTAIALAVTLTGCATSSNFREKLTGNQFEDPVIDANLFLAKEDNRVLPPESGPITVAVYGFADRTGQRKSIQNIASLSSAVTQGADAYLIKALQDAGESRWFRVVERVGLENLIKERQMIRQMREQYEGRDAKPLPPMVFAGIIIEGGIIGYDSNTLTGGSGVRLLGIGTTTQYQSDTVTVNLRTVSVATGEVLTSITITKTVLSYMDKFGVLRFVSEGTQAVEAEIGASINESINKATNSAIQAAVIATIREGARKGHWSFKQEKKDELVQANTTPQASIQAASATPKSNDTKTDGGSKDTGVRQELSGEQPKEQPKPAIKEEPKAVEQPKVTEPPVERKIQTGIVQDWSNIRTTKDMSGEKLVNLKPGTKLQILGEDEQHYRVTSEGKEGWVAKKFIKLQ